MTATECESLNYIAGVLRILIYAIGLVVILYVVPHLRRKNRMEQAALHAYATEMKRLGFKRDYIGDTVIWVPPHVWQRDEKFTEKQG